MAQARSTRSKFRSRSPISADTRPQPGVRQGAILASAIAAALHGLAPMSAAAASLCGAPATTISDAQNSLCDLGDNATLTVTETGSITTSLTNAVSAHGIDTRIVNHGHLVSGAPFTILNGGGIVELTNSGSILAQSGAISAIENISTIGTLDNSGTISSWAGIAIRNLIIGNIDNLTNAGTGEISGGTTAIQNDARIGQLVNDGTISGRFSAITNSATGTIDQIVNRGTIRAAAPLGFVFAPSPLADAIVNDGTITNGISNYGLIDGNVRLGSAELRLEGNASAVTGEVSGGVGSSVVVNGRFSAQSQFAVDSFTVSAGARLDTYGLRIESRARPFSNQGQVYVIPGALTTIAGDYVQSRGASLGFGVSNFLGTVSYGQLLVQGTARFEDGTGLFVDVIGGDALSNGKVLSSVIRANTLEATDSTFAMTDNSELFDFKPVVNSDGTVDLRAVVDGGGGGSGAPGRAVSNRVAAQGFGQAMGAARVLDGLLSSGANSGDMADVVGAFGRLGSQEQVADAVAQTLPLMSASLNQVSVNGMQGVNRVIQGRQGGLVGLSSGEGFLADKNVWFKPLASYADQDNRNGAAGYRADTYGFLLGADAKVGDASRLGMAFAYARSDVKGKSTAATNSADIDAYQLIAYGSHDLGAWPNAWVSWQADVGINDNSGRRSINFGGLDRVAKSDFDSTTAHLGAAIGRGFQISEATSFTPSLRTDYFRIHSESYTERGADALNLKVGSQTSEQLIAMAEGQLQHRLTDRASLMASLGVGYELLGEGNSIAASYVGGGAAFQTPGLEPGRWIGRAGLGLAFQAAENTQITARYDLEARSGLAAQTASVNLRWAF
ncbi:autotransporter outer membrane beta-barrel domain-containing protein [Achromobacter denitrificans]